MRGCRLYRVAKLIFSVLPRAMVFNQKNRRLITSFEGWTRGKKPLRKILLTVASTALVVFWASEGNKPWGEGSVTLP